MELEIFKRNIPLKAIDSKDLEVMIVGTKNGTTGSLVTWVSDLLSLTDEVSAKRLYIALPAIKEHCWSMGFVEIKKMFEMYADGKLESKPLPNYFDRILLGKIANEYRTYKLRINKPKKVEKSQDDIEKEKEYNEAFMQDAIKRAKKEFLDNGFIDKYFLGQYNWLEDKGEFNKINDLKKLKWDIFKKTKPIHISSLKMIVPLSKEDAKDIKTKIEHLEFTEKSNDSDLTKLCKKELLKHYYEL
jgi:hypothetical protein